MSDTKPARDGPFTSRRAAVAISIALMRNVGGTAQCLGGQDNCTTFGLDAEGKAAMVELADDVTPNIEDLLSSRSGRF
jgi:hypothetical protein